MPQFMYDAFNSFGKLSAAGDFPNTINLGEAGIERMSVDIKGALETGSVTLTVKGSDTATGAFATIVTGAAVTAADFKEGYGLPVPKNRYKYIKAAIAGAFTGTIEALINSYLGK